MNNVSDKRHSNHKNRIFFSWANDKNLPVLSVSDNVQSVLGFNATDLLSGKPTYLSLVHFQDKERLLSEIDLAKENRLEECTLTPYKIRSADGQYHYVSSTIQLIKNNHNDIEELQGYIHDTASDSEQNKLLGLVLSSTNLGLWEWDIPKKCVKFDKRLANILGYEIYDFEFNEADWQDLIHPEDIQQYHQDIHLYINGHTDLFENIHRIQHRDGRWISILDRGQIVEQNSQGQPILFKGTHTDITQWQNAKTLLKESQEQNAVKTRKLEQLNNRYQCLLDVSSEAVFIISLETGQLIQHNKLAQEYLGYNEEEMLGLSVYNWDKDITVEEFNEIAQNIGDDPLNLERIHTRKDGSTYDASILVKKITLNGLEYFHASVRDISVQNRIRRQLQSEQKLNNTIAETSSAIVAYIELDGTMTELNQYGQQFVGHTIEEISSTPYFWQRFLKPLSQQKLTDMLQNAQQGLVTTHYRNTWLNANGEHRMIEWSNTLVKDEHNEPKGISAIGIDVHDEHLLQLKLKDTMLALKEAEDVIKLGFWQHNYRNKKTNWNDNIYHILEIEKQDNQAGINLFSQHITPKDKTRYIEEIKSSIREKRPFHITHKAKTTSGQELHLEQRGHHEFNAKGELVRSIGTVQNISALIQTNQQLLLANHIIEKAINGIIITNKHNKITYANQAFLDISGYSLEELIGKNPSINQSGRHQSPYYTSLWKDLSQNGNWKNTITNKRKDGSLYTCLISINAIYDENKELLYHAAIYSDITEIERQQQQLYQLAHYDYLTELPNRVMFIDELKHSVKLAKNSQTQLSVMFVDIDRFKQINDSFGHNQGDLLLQQISKRISKHVRSSDIFSRLGGDEFVMLLENIKSVDEAGIVAQQILDCFEQPYQLENELEINITCSIGIVTYPHDGETATQLLSHADSAMYKSKSLGGGQYQFYTSAMTTEVKDKLYIESQLRHAITKQELYLAFQPQINSKTSKVSGVEALLRWQHPELGSVPPMEFIPVAEETGLIIKIGNWVLEQAFIVAKKWQEKGINFGHIAVNLSTLQLEHENFISSLEALLKKYEISAQLIELEITESVLLKHSDLMLEKLTCARELGFKFCIDDFGTGFSSLSYLKQLPVHKLKIDKSFVSDTPEDKDDVAITRTVIAMGHALGLTTIAEGVETVEQVAFLTKESCDEFQGYYYSRPIDEQACEAYIKEKG